MDNGHEDAVILDTDVGGGQPLRPALSSNLAVCISVQPF